MSLAGALLRAGYADIECNVTYGLQLWFGVHVASGTPVLARWRPGPFDRAEAVCRDLARWRPGLFPTLLDVIPVESGALFVLKREEGPTLATLGAQQPGGVPPPTALPLLAAAARLLCLCHARRVHTGTLSPRFVRYVCACLADGRP